MSVTPYFSPEAEDAMWAAWKGEDDPSTSEAPRDTGAHTRTNQAVVLFAERADLSIGYAGGEELPRDIPFGD